MKLTHRMAAAAAAIVLACGATGIVAYAKSGRSSAKEAAPRPERGTFSINVFDRGNTRQLYSSADVSNGDVAAFVQLSAATEVDATLVVFTTYGDTAAPNAAVNMYFSQLDPGVGYPCNAYLKAHDTVTYTFSPPLRLRAGDGLSASGFGDLGANGIRTEVTVFGFIPSAVRTEGMTVQ